MHKFHNNIAQKTKYKLQKIHKIWHLVIILPYVIISENIINNKVTNADLIIIRKYQLENKSE
jgi:hypothetical protein